MTHLGSPRRGCALPDSPLAREAAGLDACVHCGFCLPSCPTYLALEDENDSPRGRIVLMRALLEGELAPSDDAVTRHLDRCLGCRGCESACPSGVPYGALLEATRATIARHRPIPAVARVILATFRHPWLLRIALAFSRLVRWTRLPRLLSALPPREAFPWAMLAATESALPVSDYTPPAPAADTLPVAVLQGCVMQGLFADTNRATERVLRMNGYGMAPAPGQGCCGALHAHAGDDETARALARRNVAAFEASGAAWIAVNAAGCGAMMKEYGHLLAHDPAWAARAVAVSERVRDVTELLALRGPVPGAPLPELPTITYDAPCHLQHAQRVVRPPLAVLGAIPGLRLVPLPESDQCCGSAGIYNLVEPETSERVLATKLDRIAETGAGLVATGNPGCLMQIGAGLRLRGAAPRTVHPVDLLDRSYARLATHASSPDAD
ncbi:MAG: 4Fe-4S dicluster domain-containing protein [Gemmatimonadaceae bacterium]|nr:4Fe-4S dicluster domain-containing protein [Gemmatimonadaceae bacterium]